MLRMEEFIGLNRPFIHVVNCNWLKLEKHIESKTETFITIINGNNCNSVENTFVEFSKKFKFPNYFGGNWAAFDECINDLDWISKSSYILIIRDFNNVLKTEFEDYKILVKILKNTTVEWGNGRYYDDFPTKASPFHIIFHCETDKTDELNKRLLGILSSYEYEKVEV